MNNKKHITATIIIAALTALAFSGCAATLAHVAIDRQDASANASHITADPRLGTYSELVKISADGKQWWTEQEKAEWHLTSFDGLNLYAEYLENPAGRGTVVLMHGYHGNGATDFGLMIPLLYNRGFSILAPHQRAHGKSEGSYIAYGVNESKDVVSWCEKLNTETGKSDSPIILYGVSMGASTVLMAAGRNLPANVRGIFADCGFTSAAEILAAVGKKAMNIDDPNLVADVCITIYKIAGYDPFYSTADSLANNRIPIVIVHGEADNFVPYEMGRQNAENAGDSLAGFYSFPGAGHAMAVASDTEKYMQAFDTLLAAASV